MGRRKDHTREELFELAIVAATELVREKGPSKLTARSLADRIGYTAGTLYNVFENLDEIVAHVNARTLRRLEESFRGQAHKGDSGERLQGIARLYMGFYKKEPNLWELLFGMRLENKPDWYREAIAGTFGALSGAFVDRGLSPAQARREAKVVWATLHGLCSLDHAGKLDVGTHDSIETLAADFVERHLGNCA